MGALVGLAACILWTASGRAEVVRLQIDRREPFAQGRAFGPSGPYEKLTGRLSLETAPENPANRRVVDLGLAPRNARGCVESQTDFFLLKPADPAKGNRRLFYEVNNRGNKLGLGALNDAGANNPTTAADAGNAFLMRQGYAILWCGWNGDVLGGGDRLPDRPITGPIYAEITVNQKASSQPFAWGNSDPYLAVELDNRSATLSMRPTRSAPAQEIPRDQWAFARWEGGKAVPDAKHLYVKQGFRPGWLYDLVYVGRDPRVTGLGLAAVRDVVSFFRHAKADSQGTPNPLAGAVDRAYVFGISQSGRLIHHFLYQGFNADERGRAVFDGALVHVAGGGKGLFNGRFVQTTRHGSHHEDNLFPSDFFPFASTPQDDPLTGRRGDALQQARAAGPVPKILFTQTSAEYWCRAASLLHTDVAGRRDLPLAPEVRLYFIAGAQHGVSSTPDRGIYQHPQNILDHRPALRALLVALDRWVSRGQEPPPSRYPRIADGTLVDLAAYRRAFPRLPGISLPESFYAPLRLDLGPRWETEGIADFVPPKVGPAYCTLVPAVDRDGNDLGGVRLPDVAVPVATYTGWNLRAAASGAEGMLGRWTGSYFPFPRTARARQQSGDPRPAVLERYPTQQDYLDRIGQIARQLVREGYLLEEDAERIAKVCANRRLWEGRGLESGLDAITKVRKDENTKHNDGGRMETTRPPPLAHACSDFGFSSFRDFVILFGLPVAGKEAMLVELYRQGRISHGELAEGNRSQAAKVAFRSAKVTLLSRSERRHSMPSHGHVASGP